MEDARNMLLANVERDTRHEAAILIRDIESKTKEEADKRARNIITLAISAAPQITSRKPRFPSLLCRTTT